MNTNKDWKEEFDEKFAANKDDSGWIGRMGLSVAQDIKAFITEQIQRAREEGKREAALIAAEHMDAIPFMRFTKELLPSTTSPLENEGSIQ